VGARERGRTCCSSARYYTCLTIDPTDANIVWVPQVELVRTIDAGKNWQS
jgi:hypothetical protein